MRVKFALLPKFGRQMARRRASANRRPPSCLPSLSHPSSRSQARVTVCLSGTGVCTDTDLATAALLQPTRTMEISKVVTGVKRSRNAPKIEPDKCKKAAGPREPAPSPPGAVDLPGKPTRVRRNNRRRHPRTSKSIGGCIPPPDLPPPAESIDTSARLPVVAAFFVLATSINANFAFFFGVMIGFV